MKEMQIVEYEGRKLEKTQIESEDECLGCYFDRPGECDNVDFAQCMPHAIFLDVTEREEIKRLTAELNDMNSSCIELSRHNAELKARVAELKAIINGIEKLVDESDSDEAWWWGNRIDEIVNPEEKGES